VISFKREKQHATITQESSEVALAPFYPSPRPISVNEIVGVMTYHLHPTIDRLLNSFLFVPFETSSPAIAEKGAIRADNPYRPLICSPFLSYVFISPWLWLPRLPLLIVCQVSLDRNYKVSNLPPRVLPTLVPSSIGLLSNCNN